MNFLLRRLGHGLALLVAVSVLSFAMAELAPGDYLTDLQLNPAVSQETLGMLRERYGLDESLPVRYLRWVESILRGDLGFSVAHQAPAAALLLPRARNTLGLGFVALVLTWLVSVPLGVWSAYRPNGLLDRAAGWLSSLLLATPTIVLGLAFLLLAARVDFLPTGGMTSLDFEDMNWGARMLDRVSHLALPVLALALGGFPVVFRHTRSALGEVVEAPYLKAARAQGVGTPRLLFAHALKAAANPLVSLFGLSVAGLLSGSLIIEVIMDWPGLGPLLIESILARDAHVVVGAVLLSSVFLIGGNLLADVMLVWLDPRIRKAIRE